MTLVKICLGNIGLLFKTLETVVETPAPRHVCLPAHLPLTVYVTCYVNFRRISAPRQTFNSVKFRLLSTQEPT